MDGHESVCQINKSHNPFDEDYGVSRLRENFTSGSYGEGLETSCKVSRQSFTRQVYFKITKSYLKLAHSFRGLSYDAACAHVAIVATQYMILAIQNREQSDDRSLGELFYLMCDELDDVSYLEALEQLISLFTQLIKSDDLLANE